MTRSTNDWSFRETIFMELRRPPRVWRRTSAVMPSNTARLPTVAVANGLGRSDDVRQSDCALATVAQQTKDPLPRWIAETGFAAGYLPKRFDLIPPSRCGNRPGWAASGCGEPRSVTLFFMSGN
jgi:hypothetical protein